MSQRAGVSLAALAIAAGAVPGCGGAGGSSSGRTQVVASSYPFGYVLERIGGDAVDVQNLTAPGAEPHDLELSPRQVADLGEADLVVYESGFQPGVDAGVSESDLSAEAVVDVAEVADATGIGEELDPHVWLDPVRMQQITAAVAERLVAVDPGNAQAYRDNAAALGQELEQLHREFSTGLRDCERRTIVTAHAAFGYLAQRYELTPVAISGIGPTSEPSPAQQAAVVDLVEREGITTVFTEALVSSAVAESIADETGATVALLDPIEGLSDDTTNQTYFILMRANLAAIAQANGCA